MQPQPAEPAAERAVQPQPGEPSAEPAVEPQTASLWPESRTEPQPVAPPRPVFTTPWEPTPTEIREARATEILEGKRFSNAPARSVLSAIRAGMSDTEVLEILGDPDQRSRYTTAKLWIPFYTGPDSRRTDWIYRGEGRVVFSQNLDNGTLLAIRVIYDPRNDKGGR